ncbi:hypothetical protein NDQ71_01605 [Pseudoalteromonas sp. KG3]|uniref:hypothetical protein n=1 Tax=Pseudoalteromonas sp. KG3 TaxID=2951137 RepID=UPI002658C573|nr:hypothetical protein [Pseudoalteromonas sp. KG3]WKD23820.1 hypothetical protein NDQ71_01605 [Pseudoalteromonas sp. KG3]
MIISGDPLGAHGTNSEVYELHSDDVPTYLGRTNSKKPLEFIIDETEDLLSFTPADWDYS